MLKSLDTSNLNKSSNNKLYNENNSYTVINSTNNEQITATNSNHITNNMSIVNKINKIFSNVPDPFKIFKSKTNDKTYTQPFSYIPNTPIFMLKSLDTSNLNKSSNNKLYNEIDSDTDSDTETVIEVYNKYDDMDDKLDSEFMGTTKSTTNPHPVTETELRTSKIYNDLDINAKLASPTTSLNPPTDTPTDVNTFMKPLFENSLKATDNIMNKKVNTKTFYNIGLTQP